MARICGCYIFDPYREQIYLPQIKLDAHTTILSTASRTVLTQTFINDSNKPLEEIRYAFPLYDGISVVDFYCQVGERTIYGLVKEKNEAKRTYEEAKERGENAAVLEQLPDAADVFTTTISNIDGGESVQITIKYVQELKHDAEVDGVRLNIPTSIAPRYGEYPDFLHTAPHAMASMGMTITVDIDMVEGTPIKKIISPSHPIQVTLGSLSTSTSDEEQSLSRGSATLAFDTVELKQDFVLQVVAKDVGAPQATLETHPTLPNQRALMATLVPKFNLKSEKPEIILIADRSGSMDGPNMTTLKAALKVFLKSIPLGCTFNICSFGSSHQFLWEKSQLYDEDTLTKAIEHVETFQADFGGTETLAAVEACFKNRSSGSPTEMILLTDGDIWQTEALFDYVRQQTKNGDVRVFPLGIGWGVSSFMIEGVARAGRGFAQMVANHEKMGSKIVRMLKGALTPHINDYSLEVKYEDGSVDTVTDSLRVNLKISDPDDTKDKAETQTQPISLNDPNVKEEHPKEGETRDIYAGLPELKRPTLLQTPHKIPALFPFNRTCVYLLMAPESSHLQPKSVVLKATSPQGPLELEIPVKLRKDADEMIHQLAARKAIQELEEGHGWLSDATLDDTGVLLKERQGIMYTMLQRREAVRLGVEFQVGGRYCSFVAVEANEAEISGKRQKAVGAMKDRKNIGNDKDEDWEMLETPRRPPPDEESDEDMGFGLYDYDDDDVAVTRPAAKRPRKAARKRFIDVEAEVDEEEDDGDCEKVIVEEKEEEKDEDVSESDDDEPSATSLQSSPLLHHLISLQTFSGSWPSLSTLPLSNLQISPTSAHSALKTLIDTNAVGPDAQIAEKIFATALVICFLEQKMAGEEDMWELVVEKARTWLESNSTVGEDEGSKMEEVWKVVKELVCAKTGFEELAVAPPAKRQKREKYGLFD